MRKKHLIILVLVVGLMMTSCGEKTLDNGEDKLSDKTKLAISSGRDKKEIEEVENLVSKYFDNLLKGNYEEAYKLLASKEKEVMLLEEYKPEDVDTGDAGYDDIVRKIQSLSAEYSTYSINSVLKVEDHYEVEVLQKLVNNAQLFNQLPRSAVLTNVPASIELLDKIKSIEEVPIMETEARVKVIREDLEFKIDLGRYDTLKKAEEELVVYGEYIEIIDEKLDRYDDSAYITGSLKNYGERNIDYIMLGAKYLDNEGNLLYEETGSSYMGNVDRSIIMKPNYISNFIFTVPKNILADWNNDYELDIIGLRFLDEDTGINLDNEMNIDRAIEEKIEIDYKMDIFDNSAYIDGTVTNNSDEAVKSKIVCKMPR